MNVLPSILSYGSSSSSGTSGHCAPSSSFGTGPRILAPETNNEGKKLSFMQKLFASNTACSASPSNAYSSPVICAANPCPVILNATCVFYEGPDLIYSGINTNDSIQTALQKIDALFEEGNPLALTLTTLGTGGPATFNGNVLNIPQYQPAGSYVVTSTTLTINGVTYDLSTNRTWNVGTVTSVDLSMPSAFTVSNNPITTSGTINVAGAGTVSQYVRGDGTLADFPGTGGGSSVSYYLNGSVNQGVIGGNTYYEMSKTPVIGAGTNFSIAANGYIAQFITDVADPSLLNIPSGSWNVQLYMNANLAGGSPSFYVELYKYDGVNFTLIADSSSSPEVITGGTSIDLYYTSVAVPNTVLSITDRLAVRVYVNNSGRTITLHTEGTNLAQVITTFSTGITAINSLTSQVQFLATGTTGTDFNISSATSTHTFNLPVASAVNTGKLSNTDWSTFNNKVGGSGTTNYVPKFTAANTIGNSQIFDNGTNVVINGTTSNYRLHVAGLGSLLALGEESFLTGRQMLFGVNAGGGGEIQSVWQGTSFTDLTLNLNGGSVLVGTLTNSGYRFDVNGTGRFQNPLTLSTIANAIIDTDRFLVSDGGEVKYRTGAEVLSDIGAASSSSISGTSGQIAYFNSSSSITSSATLAFTPTSQLLVNNAVTASGAIARGANLTPTLTAAANSDALIALDINPTYTNGAFTNLNNTGLRVFGSTITNNTTPSIEIRQPNATSTTYLSVRNQGFYGTGTIAADFGITGSAGGFFSSTVAGDIILKGFSQAATSKFFIGTTSSNQLVLFPTNNVAIGTATDAGFRLDISGTARTQQQHTFLQGTSLDATSAQYFHVVNTGTGNTQIGGLQLNNSTQNYSAYIFTGRSGSANTITFQHLTLNAGADASATASQRFALNSTVFGVANNTTFNHTLTVFNRGGGTITYPYIAGNHINTTNSGVGYLYQTVASDATTTINHGAIAVVKNNLATTTVTSNMRFLTISDAANTLSEKMRISDAANVLINTTTDAGFRLDVNGTARVQGATTISTGGADITGGLVLSGGGNFTMRGGAFGSTRTITFQSEAGNNTIGSITATQLGTNRSNIYIYASNLTTGSLFKLTGGSSAAVTAKLTGGQANNGSLDFFQIQEWNATPETGNILSSIGNLGQGRFGQGTNEASAVLQANSTTAGFLPPRMTSAQRTAIASPATGLVVYQTDGTEGLYVNTSTGWRSLTML